MKPLISVVIPTYNRAEMVIKAVESVLKQNYENFELLVCDDGSTDDTEKLIRCVKDDRIKYLKQENKGSAGVTRNLGIKNAKGELIAFLDDDDSWQPEHLKSCAEFFELYPEAGMMYTQTNNVFESENVEIKYEKIEVPYIEKIKDFRLYTKPMFDEFLMRGLRIPPSCVVVKKEVFDKIGNFDENVYHCDDLEMWLRISNKYRIGIVRRKTVNYLIHSKSMSGSISEEKISQNRLKMWKSVSEKCDLNEEQKQFIKEKLTKI
ncbi:glycosyltransferase family 2 protein [Candidatus Woesearchaeota archaeon]|nr:glycosyltransferase family 2 protein [Candidatus Woesearchaeota archaeon]